MSARAALAEIGNESLATDPVSAFVCDRETLSAVQSALRERWPSAAIHEGGLSAALGALSLETPPRLLVVDVSGVEDADAGIRSLLALCDRTTRIVALGTVNDISYYRRLTALGVSDYLVKPIEPAALSSALAGAEKPRPALQAVEPEKPTCVLAVVGARGGVGASTVAVNLAWLSAHERKRSTAIVDLDLQFGTVGLQLDLEPSHGLREALENPERIDGLFIASAMANESENLYVLSAEEPLSEHVRVSPEACGMLIEALPAEMQAVVLDIPMREAVANPALLKNADRIVLVADFSLVGMRDAGRIARLCREQAPDAALHVVANRAGIGRRDEIPKAEFAKGTDLPLGHVIPFDPRLAALSANTGRALPKVAPKSPLVKALRGLADDVLRRRDEVSARPSPVARLLALARK
jgi:pilus assembly protein CpaE